jgi:putative polymerase
VSLSLPFERSVPVQHQWAVWAGPAVVASAVFFNFGLAFINAQVMGLSASHVILAEAGLVGLSHVIILRNYDRLITPWYLLLAFLLIMGAARWCLIGTVDPKAVRDVILIPTFFALGIAAGPRAAAPLLLLLQVVTTGVVLFEVIALDLYSWLFNVKGFYIATRGLAAEAFWNNESTLFVSATRPGQRNLFPFLDIHRASSVFLEPVSLGNYCIIVAAYVSAYARTMSRPLLVFYLLTTIILLVACDGRLAIMVTAAIVGSSLFRPRVPRASFFFLPVIVLVSFAVDAVVDGRTDDLPGRSSLAAYVFSRFGLPEWLGMSRAGWAQSADSGITFLIVNQSILGAVAIWLYITLVPAEESREQAVFKRSALIFLVTTMLISNSYLSIKTAALLWFLLGTTQRAADPAGRRSG